MYEAQIQAATEKFATLLREQLTRLSQKHHFRMCMPELWLCTDNAAMIATAGHYRYMAGEISDLEVSPVARLQDL